MGDRFYTQQLNSTGNCPGFKGKRRQRVSTWTDELKAEVIKAYEEAEPTPENSMEIVKSLAEEHDQTPNGVRMILTKAGVYVKKTPAAASEKGASKSGGGARTSKAAAHQRLRDALSELDQSLGDDIVDKMTGKAAVAIAEVLEAVKQ